MKKVFIVGGDINYANWLTDCEITDALEEANIVIFVGGEDINPKLYNETPLEETTFNLSRDTFESKIYNKINPKTQIAVGIGRGAQLLYVLNGGKLIQHVEGHNTRYTHEIVVQMDDANYIAEITSLHHQMMYPDNLDEDHFNIIGYTSRRLSVLYLKIPGSSYKPSWEPEIIHVHKDNAPQCLCIQGHPEIMRKEAPINILLNKLVEKILNTLS